MKTTPAQTLLDILLAGILCGIVFVPLGLHAIGTAVWLALSWGAVMNTADTINKKRPK